MKPDLPFENRLDAGQQLAQAVAPFCADLDKLLVLALPRGGVPVAHEVAQHLAAPLDVLIVRKLGLPGHAEFAMGAIASGGVLLLNDELVRQMQILRSAIEEVVHAELQELKRREMRYRGERPALALTDRNVFLVDDGMATGFTMQAAVEAVRRQRSAAIVVAVPVASAQAYDQIRPLVDRLVCLSTPEPFQAVGRWYRQFAQTDDEEVHAVLAQRRHDE